MKTLHVIGLATALTLSAMHNARSAEPTPAPGEEVTKAYTRSILADYSFPCKEAVEADAYNLRWTNGWFEFPFNSWAKRRWHDGTIRLMVTKQKLRTASAHGCAWTISACTTRTQSRPSARFTRLIPPMLPASVAQ